MGCWASCIGEGKPCRDCKDRCNSWFPGDQDLQCGCKERCASGDTSFSRDDYLNTLGFGPEQEAEIEEHNQWVLQQQAKDAEDAKETVKTILSVAIGVILIALILFIAIKYLK